MMRTWLLYKVLLRSGGDVQVDFARLDDRGLTRTLPPNMTGPLWFLDSSDLEREINSFVRRQGWVAEPARDADSDIGKVLIGRRAWPAKIEQVSA